MHAARAAEARRPRHLRVVQRAVLGVRRDAYEDLALVQPLLVEVELDLGGVALAGDEVQEAVADRLRKMEELRKNIKAKNEAKPPR